MNQHLERLDGMAPFMVKPVMRLIERCQISLGRRLLVVSGYRSAEEQRQKYQQGRRLVGGVWLIEDELKIITRALPGLTPHNVVTVKDHAPASVAVDLIPLFDDGRADWHVSDAFWANLYELSWKVGLDPLGDEIGAVLKNDKGHFEEPAWKLKLEGLGLMQPLNT